MEPQEIQANNKLIPLAIIVAGLLVAASIYFGGGKTGPLPTSTDNTATNGSIEVAKVTAEDHILGNPAAPVVVVEYSDLECPFCKVFHNTMHQVINGYKTGQVAWVYRQFPIASLHSKAPKEAEASECANELGGNSAFWSFIDKVFSTTDSNNALDPLELPKIAGDIGLDVTAFNQCLSNGKYSKFITDSVARAVKAGARGTPYSVVISNKSGKQASINGAQDFSTVKATIDSLL